MEGERKLTTVVSKTTTNDDDPVDRPFHEETSCDPDWSMRSTTKTTVYTGGAVLRDRTVARDVRDA